MCSNILVFLVVFSPGRRDTRLCPGTQMCDDCHKHYIIGNSLAFKSRRECQICHNFLTDSAVNAMQEVAISLGFFLDKRCQLVTVSQSQTACRTPPLNCILFSIQQHAVSAAPLLKATQGQYHPLPLNEANLRSGRNS